MPLSIPSSVIYPPQPILTNQEYEVHIEQSTEKLWTNDSEIKDRIYNKNVILSTNIRSFFFRANVHTQKLFKLANITPIKNLYETEAIKFVFSYISDTTRDQQPKAIHKILFHNTDVTRKTRFHDDESKIKINHEYRKGQAIYNLITIWNNANPKLRFAGNHWSLKNMLRTEINSEMKPCTIRNCFTCTLDRKRNYQNYMTK